MTRVERAKVSTLRGLRYVPYLWETTSLNQPPSGEISGDLRVWRCAVGLASYTLNRPAAAVIPAPIAYIKVVAVKKLVVEPWIWLVGPPHRVH